MNHWAQALWIIFSDLPEYSRLEVLCICFSLCLGSPFSGIHIDHCLISFTSLLRWQLLRGLTSSTSCLTYPEAFFLEWLLLPEMMFHFNFLIVSCLKWFTVVSLLSKTRHGIWQCKIKTSFLENSSMIKLISLFIIGKTSDTLRLRIVKSLCQDQIIIQWYH